jgi:hypothetical protein
MKTNIIVYILIGLVFVVTASFVYQKNSYDNTVDNYALMSVAQSNTLNLNTGKLPLNAPLLPLSKDLDKLFFNELKKSKFTLLVLFEPTSCGTCLGENILWNELRKSGTLNIIGVSSVKDSVEMLNYIKNGNINIPIYIDTTAVIGKTLEPAVVPVKFLLNNEGKILLTDYVREKVEDQQRFKKMLEWYIKR